MSECVSAFNDFLGLCSGSQMLSFLTDATFLSCHLALLGSMNHSVSFLSWSQMISVSPCLSVGTFKDPLFISG